MEIKKCPESVLLYCLSTEAFGICCLFVLRVLRNSFSGTRASPYQNIYNLIKAVSNNIKTIKLLYWAEKMLLLQIF